MQKNVGAQRSRPPLHAVLPSIPKAHPAPFQNAVEYGQILPDNNSCTHLDEDISNIYGQYFPISSICIIPKQPEESVFGVVGFVPDFSSRASGSANRHGASAGRKIWDASLPNSRFFSLFGYICSSSDLDQTIIDTPVTTRTKANIFLMRDTGSSWAHFAPIGAIKKETMPTVINAGRSI